MIRAGREELEKSCRILRGRIEMIKKLIFLMNKRERHQLPVLFLEIILGALLETVGISAILPIINVLINPNIISGDGYIAKLYEAGRFDSLYSFEITLMITVICFFIIKNLFLFLMRYHQNFFVNKGQQSLTQRLMKTYFSQPYIYFTKKNPADLQRNVSADVGKCYQTVLSILTIVTQGCVAVMLVGFLMISDWMITMLILGLIIVTMLIFLKITHHLNIRYGNISREQGEKVIQWINQSFGGIKEVKLFNRERFFLTKIDNAYSQSATAECMVNVISSVPNMIMELISICAIMIAAIVKIQMGGDLNEFVSVLAAFALAAIRLIPTVGNVSLSINRVAFNKASIQGIFDELKSLERNNNNDVHIDSGCDKIIFKDKIMIDNVCFRYPEGEKNVLTDVSFEILRGQSVAFIGPSGAGKTTMADIILGILTPSSGSIKVDGENITSNIQGWYKQIGYIPQSIYLMDDSIRNNIAFGLGESEIDDDKVWKALRRAQLEEFVRELPDGLDTNLGDRGIRCSGGQRQRLGIARALYDDPEFLILDEATSALDNDTERAIMEAIDGLKGKKTILIIAHRLSTTKNCDIIYKIESENVMRV